MIFLMNIKTSSFLSNSSIIYKRRFCIIFIILLSAIVFLCIGELKSNVNFFIKMEKYSDYSSYDISKVDAQGYLNDNGTYITLHNDPWFTSDNINDFLYDISLKFTSPLPQNTLIEIFYKNRDEDFSPNNKVTLQATKGNVDLYMPLNQYVTSFRLDIGNSLGQIIPEFEIYFKKISIAKVFVGLTIKLVIILLIIFDIYILLKYYGDKKTSYKVCLFAILLFFVFLIIIKANDSNMMVFSELFPNNIAAINPTVLGNPRAVRSDEWACNLTADLYRMQQENKGIESFADIILFCINPQNWGYLLLPLDMGFSWARMTPYFVSFIAVFYFFHIFIKDSVIYPFFAAIILVWSPEIMWWNSLTVYMHFFLVFDLVYLFFHTLSKQIKVFCCIGLFISIGTIMVTIYPAWHILLVYLGIFLLAGVFLQEKRIGFKKSDIIYITVTCVFLFGFILCYFISQKEFISSVANTVYPGKRESIGGDLPLRYLAHYLLAPLLPFRDITFSNNSEVSSFISLFPMPVLLYLYRKDDLKKHKILNSIFLFICICAVYMLIGFPLFLSKLTLWSYSFSLRVNTLLGLSCSILLILEVYYIQKNEEKNKIYCLQKNVSFYILILLFFFYIYMKEKNIVDYLGIPLFCTLAIGVVILGYISLKGNIKTLLITLSILTIISGVTVNPLVIGTDIMLKTPIAKAVKILDKEDSGNWIAVDGDIWKSKYLRAQGVECLNALSYPPRFDLFLPLDPAGENIDIYNRYAHVNIRLCNEKSSFNLVYTDHIHIDLNIDDMKKWNVKYVLTTNQLELNTNVLSSELVYTDALDGNYIYKIHYK